MNQTIPRKMAPTVTRLPTTDLMTNTLSPTGGVSIPISNLVVLDGTVREFEAPVTAPLPANPQVTVSFENIFAPQSAEGAMPVKTYSAPLTVTNARLALQDAAPVLEQE